MDDGWSALGDTRPDDRGSLRRYLETIRERRWFVLLAVVLCTLAATVYALTAPKVYVAHADMLVTPIPQDDTAVLGLGLLRENADPTQDVTTASRLIDNTQVAAQVQHDLGLSGSPQTLLNEISVDPVANSSIVSITASTGSPTKSQQLANAFAVAAVAVRMNQLHQALVPAIASMRQQITAVAGNPAVNVGAQPLYQQLATMESLLGAPDPTLRLEAPATLPTSPSSPRTKLDIAGGLLAGLLLGIAGAFALNAIDPRKAREGGLSQTGLPVLTRVPLLRRSGRKRHAFDEAFRDLRTTLRFAADESPIHSVAVTSPSEKEGKTTTSFQLAMAMLEAGQSVILVEADPFRPGLRRLVKADVDSSRPGLLEYLAGTADLDEVIERTSVPRLMFVAAGFRQPRSITGLLESERGRSFVSNLSGLADIVILDGPPVGPRSDAVLIASYTDAVVVVVDFERSDEDDLLETVRRLRRTTARLLGIVVNRDSTSVAYEYRSRPERHAVFGRTLSARR